ncbi:MAG: glutamate--tRNA ligase [Candidatus Marinimicrobia bacterium]|nr:glutamate--tRNA ligase [Candidatus Neomarinimicrobiota bacterium]
MIVTRFAPSPTGYLHVGGLRTALYNYLYAKQNDGKFILRIEDTDQKRYQEGAVENLLNSLKMVGLEYDNGPNRDDENAPYFQSERTEIYKKEVTKLIKDGNAYRCFCSAERLKKLHEKQIANNEDPKYDGKCRNISQAESDERAKNEPFTIRLKVPETGGIIFKDKIRGKVKIDYSEVSDQILIKTDGFPTYHLANVVDDHYMKISHVIRGEEWLSSLPKHLLLYHYLGWKPPKFAHVPLLLNADKSKLSKRQGDVAVEDYLKKGYLSSALLNFLALLGWNPGGKKEIFSLGELIKEFSLERINKSGSVFDIKKLDWMNGQYIRKMSDEDYFTEAKKWIDESEIKKDKLEIALKSLKPRLIKLTEIQEKLKVFTQEEFEITDSEAKEIIEKDSTKIVLKNYIEKVNSTDELTGNEFYKIMKAVQNDTGIKGKDLWMPIRIALTGEMHGPELDCIVEYFGRDENVRRVGEFV